MIIKALSRKAGSGNINQLLRYALRYISNPQKSEQLISKPLVKHNIRGASLIEYLNEFKSNEMKRVHTRSNQICLHHFIISFSPGDSDLLNDKKLRVIAKKFIQLWGENNLVLAVKHEDRAHKHIHLISSATQIGNGYASRKSKIAFAVLKEELSLFQQTRFPELIHSQPAHQRLNEPKALLKRLPSLQPGVRRLQKDLLLETVHQVYKASTSEKQFFTNLRSKGYEPYYRVGKLTGVQKDGRKYRLGRLGFGIEKLEELNQKGKKIEKELTTLQSIRARSQKKELVKDNGFERTREIEINERQSSIQGFGDFPSQGNSNIVSPVELQTCK